MWTPPGSPDTSHTNLERQGRIALTLSLFRRASFVNWITANRRLGARLFGGCCGGEFCFGLREPGPQRDRERSSITTCLLTMGNFLPAD